MEPCLVSYSSDLSAWFYSSRFVLYHCRLAGFFNQLPHLPTGPSLSKILFSPSVDGFPHPSLFREVKAPVFPQNLQDGVGSPHPSGSRTPTFPLRPGLRKRVNLTSWFVCELILLEKILTGWKRRTTSENLVVKVCNGFRGGAVVKESAGPAGDSGSVPGSVGSLEKESIAHPRILAWEMPWMEEPGGLQSTGSQSRTRQGGWALRLPTADFFPQFEGECIWPLVDINELGCYN